MVRARVEEGSHVLFYRHHGVLDQGRVKDVEENHLRVFAQSVGSWWHVPFERVTKVDRVAVESILEEEKEDSVKSKVKCPSCGSDQFFWREQEIAYYTVDSCEADGHPVIGEHVEKHDDDFYCYCCKKCDWTGAAISMKEGSEMRKASEERNAKE